MAMNKFRRRSRVCHFIWSNCKYTSYDNCRTAFGKFISKRIHVDVLEHFKESEVNYDSLKLAGFAGVVIMLSAPLILILGNTTANLLLNEGNIFREILLFSYLEEKSKKSRLKQSTFFSLILNK